MSRSKAKVALVVILVIAVLACLLYAYSIWWERVQYLRWLAWRQGELRNLGWRVRAFAKEHEDFDPQSMDALVAAGILAPGEVTFEDAWREAIVTRVLVPRSEPERGDAGVLLVERYSSPTQECNVLMRNGDVAVHRSDICHPEEVADDGAL